MMQENNAPISEIRFTNENEKIEYNRASDILIRLCDENQYRAVFGDAKSAKRIADSILVLSEAFLTILKTTPEGKKAESEAAIYLITSMEKLVNKHGIYNKNDEEVVKLRKTVESLEYALNHLGIKPDSQKEPAISSEEPSALS